MEQDHISLLGHSSEKIPRETEFKKGGPVFPARKFQTEINFVCHIFKPYSALIAAAFR